MVAGHFLQIVHYKYFECKNAPSLPFIITLLMEAFFADCIFEVFECKNSPSCHVTFNCEPHPNGCISVFGSNGSTCTAQFQYYEFLGSYDDESTGIACEPVDPTIGTEPIMYSQKSTLHEPLVPTTERRAGDM